ncbi:TonB-dependent receptor plug domain-containing protein [Hymenobacter yonginensis]|uniref:TonB-dependent receptor plug domain-containing protein n=1 Tax=Hymenobacter yonginensis TaxID=748197 RepID=A0ABY7PLW5_9BACT|nr:TonB-dependent receptor plug domain-containing protein [Hymenobacter yonginensis]WBO83684.1 TonB-dependent receptor plug domain-containing protein [Hymenobacter yonginensis]
MPLSLPRLLPVACLSLGALAAFTAFQEADPVMQRLATRLQAYYAEGNPEISYLHLNQAAYVAGETVWFKAYVVDGSTHQPDSLSRVLYVDMISPSGKQVALRRMLPLRGGLAHGDIMLPDSLPQGIYTLRAYTNWMRNSGEELFFSRRVPVWQAVSSSRASSRLMAKEMSANRRESTTAARPDVQFFPEGGDYVAGLATIVGVKALDATGTGLAVRGTILDDQNQPHATFSTSALGMTGVSFTPVAGRRYFARVVLPAGTTADYPLPAVRPDGWVLNVRDAGPDLQVFIRYQPPQGAMQAPTKLRLLGHVRGAVVYTGAGQIQGSETFMATVPKADLPAGIVHFTLFDDQQIARAERLAFVPDPAPLRLRLQPEKTTYGLREVVSMTVDVRTAAGQPVTAELSASVASVAEGLPATGTTDVDVESHLLLTSELKGYLENPGYYFRQPTPETRRALDHLLLTQGWSRFVWGRLLASDVSPAAAYQFLPEQTLTVSGQLMRLNEKPVPNGALTLFQGASKGVTVGQTDATGRFTFTGFSGQDSSRVLVQARTEKGGSNVMVKLDKLWPLPAKPTPLPLLASAAAPPAEVAVYAQRSRRQQVLEQQYRPDSSRSIVLRNVTVKGSRPTPPRHDPRSIHLSADVVLRTRDIPAADNATDIFQLLQGRVSGMDIFRSDSANAVRVRIRGISTLTGGGGPLLLLDGIQLPNTQSLQGIPPSMVERIEVLKGPSAAIYGMRGMGGVIAVFTKHGNPDYDYSQEKSNQSVVVYQLPAYYRPREFYAPGYEKSPAANRPDPRATTLHWLPRLPVPASGPARFTFYTADEPGTFRVRVEGIGATGQPVTGSAVLVVADR